MSTRRSTSNRDAADAATTEEAQGQEVSGGSSHGSASLAAEEPAMRPRGDDVTTPENVMKNLNSQVGALEDCWRFKMWIRQIEDVLKYQVRGYAEVTPLVGNMNNDNSKTRLTANFMRVNMKVNNKSVVYGETPAQVFNEIKSYCEQQCSIVEFNRKCKSLRTKDTVNKESSESFIASYEQLLENYKMIEHKRGIEFSSIGTFMRGLSPRYQGFRTHVQNYVNAQDEFDNIYGIETSKLVQLFRNFVDTKELMMETIETFTSYYLQTGQTSRKSDGRPGKKNGKNFNRSRGERNDKRCWVCDEEDHLSFNCPNKHKESE